MQIPLKPSTVGLPGSSASAASLTRPVPEGTGLASLGQNVAGVGALAPAFAHAQAIRDAQQAKLDALQAHLGTDTQLMQAQQDVADLTKDSLAAIQQHYAQGGTKPYLTIPGQHGGDPQNVDPRVGFKANLSGIIQKHVDAAKANYGDYGAAIVANQLRTDSHAAYSHFEDERLKLGIAQAGANVHQNIALHVATMATDPFEGASRIKDSIQEWKVAGADPLEAEKLQQESIKNGWDGYYQLKAQNNPLYINSIGKSYKVVDESTGKESWKTEPVPPGMPAADVDKYKTLAQATINRDHAEADRLEKDAQKATKAKQDLNADAATIAIYNGKDVGTELSTNLDGFSGDDRKLLYGLNHTVRNQNRADVTEEQVKASNFQKNIGMFNANKLFWNEDMLKSFDEDVVKRWVTKDRTLLPQDAPEIYNKIQEARKHFASEDGASKQGQKAAFDIGKNLFKLPPQIDPTNGFELQRLNADWDQQLIAQLEQDKTHPVEKAMALAANYETRVLSVQKASADSLDQELTTNELATTRAWGLGAKNKLFTDKHEIVPEQRKSMEEQYPMLKGIFLQHDAKVARWNELVTFASQQNKVTTGAKR